MGGGGKQTYKPSNRAFIVAMVYKRSIGAERINLFFVKFVFYFFKTFGLATINFKITRLDNKTWNWKFVKSKIGIFYNIVLTLAFAALKFVGLSYVKKNKYRKGAWGYKAAKFFMINDVFMSTCVSIILLAFSIRQSKCISLANKIQRMQESLETRSKATLNRVIAVGVGNIVIFVINLVLPMINDKGDVYPKIAYNAAYVLTVFVTCCLLLQYAMVLKKLRDLFSAVDDNLKKLSSPFTISRETRSTQSFRFAKLMDSYDYLIELSREVANFYSMPMLFGISSTFVSSLENSFAVAKVIFVDNKSPNTRDCRNLLIVCMNIISVFTLGINVTKTEEQVCNSWLIINIFFNSCKHIFFQAQQIKRTVSNTIGNLEEFEDFEKVIAKLIIFV